MSQLVTDSSGNKHSFPDEATPEMIAQALGVQYSAQSMSAPRHAPMLAEKPSMLRQALDGVSQRLNEARGGAAEGVAGTADMFANAVKPFVGGSNTLDQTLNDYSSRNGMQPMAPHDQPFRSKEEMTQILYDPTGKTTPPVPTDRLGKYLKYGARGAAGAAAFPGSPLINAFVGTGSGLTGEAAVDVSGTEGTPAEAKVRLIAELLGGIGTGLGAGAIRSTPAQLFKEAIDGLTDQQLMAAQKLLDDSIAAGSRLTVPEAIAQVTGRNTDLTGMQRVAEQSREGSKIFDPMMANRPAANRTAFDQAVHNVNPTPSASPETLAPRIAAAAESVVKDATGARSTAVRKYYNSASTVPVSPTGAGGGVPKPIQSLVDDIDQAVNKDLGGVGADSAAGKKLLQFKDEILAATDSNGNFNVGTLNNLYKTWRDNITSSPMDNPNATGKTVGGIVGRVNDKLGMLLERESPELAGGNALYKSITESVVDPLKQGPTGRLAEATTYDAVANTLMPVAPKDVTAASITRTISQLKMKNPDLIPEFVRTNLEAIWNQATRNLQSGSNQWGGAGFAKASVGNAEQAKILQTLIESMPGGQTKWAGFRSFLNIMEAQGKRQFPGSATEFNRMLNADLGATNLSMVAKPGGWLNQMAERWRYGKNTGEIARVFTDPKGVELLSKLALTKPNNAKAATLAAELTALISSQSPAQPSQ